jgi:hypothetical protein
MDQFNRVAWSLGYRILGIVFSFFALLGLVGWPWFAATRSAARHGHPRGTADYNSAGWTAELLYLGAIVALVAFGTLGERSRRQRRVNRPAWRHAPADPFGMQRWWDGSDWTDTTRWDFDEVPFNRQRFRHGSCALRHRTRSTAALHNSLTLLRSRGEG